MLSAPPLGGAFSYAAIFGASRKRLTKLRRGKPNALHPLFHSFWIDSPACSMQNCTKTGRKHAVSFKHLAQDLTMAAGWKPFGFSSLP